VPKFMKSRRTIYAIAALWLWPSIGDVPLDAHFGAEMSTFRSPGSTSAVRTGMS
jgi:hypothetical protein